MFCRVMMVLMFAVFMYYSTCGDFWDKNGTCSLATVGRRSDGRVGCRILCECGNFGMVWMK